MKINRLVLGELQMNCYLVSDDAGETVIIDPGDSTDHIQREIESRSLTPRTILLTHGHADHTFAAGLLQSRLNLDIVVHEGDRWLVEHGPGDLEVFFDMHDYVAPTMNKFLQDGEVIEVGSLKLSVIHTPGHTPGGVSILCDGELFSGDTLFARGIGRTDLPGGSHDELMNSIQTRLFALDDTTRVYPGHGPETTIGEERQSNPWLR